MTKHTRKLNILLGILLVVCALSGCSDPNAVKSDDYIIRLGDNVLTVAEFNKVFEITKAAYPYSEMKDPDAVKNAKLRLLNQMSEEMIIEAKAKELGITISDDELAKAVSEIKQDYPDDVFQQMLLEYAVPYEIWEKRVKTRLLLEKVIAQELGQDIVVTPDDITKYYEENDINIEPAADPKENSQQINTNIVKLLRREKVEAKYQPWLKNLKKAYNIEINKPVWKKIIARSK